MSDEELGYEPSLLRRLVRLGPSYFVKSYDTLALVTTVLIVYQTTGGTFPQTTAESLLGSFAMIAASLFAIVLTGLTIITSFTDKLFVLAWKEVEEYDNIITVFQYNLYLPIIVLLFSIGLRYLWYNSQAMILMIGLFSYMVFSLIGLVNLISKYALQRGEFIKRQMGANQSPPPSDEKLSEYELRLIRRALLEKEDETNDNKY